MNYAELFFRRIAEVLLFVLVAIATFNLLADFAANIGIVGTALNSAQLQVIGIMSYLLAVVNAVSTKFFGFALAR